MIRAGVLWVLPRPEPFTAPCEHCYGVGWRFARDVVTYEGDDYRCPECEGSGRVPFTGRVTIEAGEDMPGHEVRLGDWVVRPHDNELRRCQWVRPGRMVYGCSIPLCSSGVVGTANIQTVLICPPAWPKSGCVIEEPVEGVWHLVNLDDLSWTDVSGQWSLATPNQPHALILTELETT